MNQQTSELIKRVKQLGPTGLARLDPDVLDEIQAVLETAAHDDIEAKIRREEASFDCGPFLWLTRYTKTENPQYEAQGLPFLAPFPAKEYFVHLFRAFLKRSDQLFVCKSRTMMTSWAAAGYAAWCAQWKREEVVVQTLNVDRAMHLIDYVRQLFDHQEPWISKRHPLEKRSAFAIAWKGGGEVAAIPSGADAIRAFHPTTYIQDESAFMPEGQEALGAVQPTGAKIICISTAAPGWFGDACSV